MVDISDLSVYTNMVNNSAKFSTDLANINQQIASGKKIINFESLAELGSSEILLSHQTTISKYNSYIASNQNIITTGDILDENMEALIKLGQEVQVALTSMQSVSGSTMQFSALSRGYLKNIEAILNSSYQNKYLFSGTGTNTNPVSDLVKNSNLINGQVSNNYYTGGGTQLSVVIDDGNTVSYGPLADNMCFQNLIGALNMGIEADIQNSGGTIDQAKVAAAIDLINLAMEGLIETRSVLGNNMKSVENKLNEQQNLILYYGGLVAEINETDIPAAMILANGTLAQTEASYMLMRILQKTNLADYL